MKQMPKRGCSGNFGVQGFCFFFFVDIYNLHTIASKNGGLSTVARTIHL